MEDAVSQHLLSLTGTQLAMVDRALTDLEALLFPSAAREGDQPPAGDLAIPSAPMQQVGARSGLAKLDPVRRRLQRLQRLVQQARDAEVTLVNDALNLRGYVLLQETGVCLAKPDPVAAMAEPTQPLRA
jgi:hypothetical protein